MRRTAQKPMSLLLALALAAGLAVPALAKTSSEAIPAPADDAAVFTVRVADTDKEISYTWADIGGKGDFSAETKTYGAKVDGVQTTQAWTGVSLLALLEDAAERSGVTLADTDLVKALAADDYATSFTVGDVRDDGNYLVAADPVKNFDGDKTYPDTYVRILRGDKDTLSNQANLRCVTGVEITLVEPATDPAEAIFSDLEGYGWALEAITELAGRGVVSGDGKGAFLPANPIRRGDFMLMLARAYDLKADKAGDNFADVAEGSYWYDAIAAAKALGIARGSGDRFNPEGTLTRQDAMTLLYRTLEGKGLAPEAKGDLSAFSDGDDVAPYAEEAVQALVGAEIITGAGGKLSPTATMTRAELSVALYKALTKLG